MTEPTQEMLDAWAKIPKVTDRPQCRVCRSTDVTLFTVQTVSHRWGNNGIPNAQSWWRKDKFQQCLSSESMGCNRCKTLDMPVLTKFSMEEA